MLPNTAVRRIARLSCTCLSLIALAGATTTSRAATVTFAQFIEQDGANDFVFTNNGSTANFGTIAGGVQVAFKFSNIASLPLDLKGFQDATLTMNLTASSYETTSGGTAYQPLSGTISIRLNSPASEGSGSRTNLLTITLASRSTSGSLSGSTGANSASLSPSTPQDTVTYSSDFLSFSGTSQRNFALSFSSITPALSTSGNFLSSFTAAGSGTFAADPAPLVQITGTPEPPACLLVAGAAGVVFAAGRLRRRGEKSPTVV